MKGDMEFVESPKNKPRERWSSRWTFIIASVGSAIGLGNIWRFPFLNYKHGGGAFLIPYIMFLLVTGVPLLQTELALGRLFQKGDIEAFGSINKRCRGVGSISVVGGFGVVTYYSAIIAWALYYAGASFIWPFPWATDSCGADAECMADPERALPLSSSDSYYLHTVMKFNEDNVAKGTATVISAPLFGCLLVTWAVCYFCIWKGVASVGIAAKITVIVPWCLMAIFIIYNATLEGSLDGIRAYIGEWDLEVLQNGDAWSDAAGQIFFTLGATLGIMSAYGSFAPATTNIWADNNYICYINCITSFFAGFAVFSILGNMAYRQREIAGDSPALRNALCTENAQELSCPTDCGLCEGDDWMNLIESGVDVSACCGNYATDNVAKGGVFLVFSVYPASLQYLSRGGANILSIMWFGMLFLLGIDSMFAMVEGVATVLTDTPRFRHVRKEQIAAITCVLGFLGSVAFISDLGFALLDIFDHYIINYGLFLTGALEAYAVAWVWGWYEISKKCGQRSAMLITAGYTVGAVGGVALAGALYKPISTGGSIGVGLAFFAVVFLGCGAASYAARSSPEMTVTEWIGVWGLAGTRNLRRTFQVDPKPSDTILHIISYDIPIKYLCPAALLALFMNQIIFDATQFENGYGDYPNWLHGIAGGLVLGIMILALLTFAVYPDFWDKLGIDENMGAQVAYYPADGEKVDDDVSTGAKTMFTSVAQDGWGKCPQRS